MRKVIFYFLCMFMMVSLAKAQDDTTVIITEARFDGAGNAYVEFTNVGNSPEQMGNYLWAVCHPGNSSPDPMAKLGNGAYFFRFPDSLLGPGESYVVSNHRDVPSEWGEDLWEKTSQIADFLVYVFEAEAGDKDSSSTYNRALQWYGGLPPGFLFYGVEGTGDSVAVDMINASWNEDQKFSFNPTVAGVQEASASHVLVRKSNRTSGLRNTADWDISRGAGPEDSDWIVLPHYGRNELFTTIDHHGDASIDVSAKSGSGVNVDLGAGTIEVPWYVRKGDSIIDELELGPGMAWLYFENPSSADSAFTSVRNDDTLRLYAVGDELETLDLKIIVSDPTDTDAIVVPKRTRVFPDPVLEPGAGPFWAAPPYYVTEDCEVDTIGGVPFAERVDSVLRYLIKPENATWEIEWVDDQERVDLKDGDKLIVTAADEQTTKEYYIAVDDYEPSHNAHLSAITWPDILSELGYEPVKFNGDTIPNFNSTAYSYHITLPIGTNKVPVLSAIPENANAKIITQPAVSVKGSMEDRTTVFTVHAEDDTTINEYKVTFAVQRTEVQPFEADPFISQYTHRYYHRSNYWEFFNPGTELVSMDRYMFVRGSGGQGPIDALTDRLDDYTNRLWHYVPGYRYPDEATFNADPMKLIPDPTVDVILESGETWVAGTHPPARNRPGPEARGHLSEDPVEIHFTRQIENRWGETFEWANVWSWPIRWHHKLYLFKVLNDSVLDGDKAIGDPKDYELIDAWWDADESGPAWDVAGRGEEIANEHAWGFWRKTNIYKGNTDGTSFGTHPDTSEWNTQYWRDNQGSYYDNMGSVVVGLGNHSIDPVTAYISIVNSNTLDVSSGYTGLDETISGDLGDMTVSQLKEELIKFDEGQTIAVPGKGDDDQVAAGDTVIVTSADEVNHTKYALMDQALGSDATLVSLSDNITVEVNGSEGTVSGVQFGMTLRSLMDSLVVPVGAKLYVMDKHGDLQPTQILSLNDTSYVDSRVSGHTTMKVVAENFKNQVVYSVETNMEASAAYVTSSLYTVNDSRMTISDLPPAQTVPTFMRNIQPVKGATVMIKDKAGFVRDSGYIHADDVLEVVSENEEMTNVYNINFMGEVNLSPEVNVIWADTTISAGETIDLMAEVKDDGLPYGSILEVNWNVVSGNAQNVDIVDHGMDWARLTFSEADNVEVEVSVSDGEFTVTDKYSITIEATNIDAIDQPSIALYPNPASDYITLELDNINTQDVKVKIFSVVGKQVYENTDVNNTLNINLRGLESGVYFIKVESQNYSTTKKFNIMK